MEQKPLYPFGFGLSYTGFRFDAMELSGSTMTAGGSVTAKVKLTNTGSRDAEEVVQIYIAKEKRGVDDPITSLRAFRRIAVPADKTVSAEFALPASAFETINAEGENVLAAGAYTVTAADAAPVPVAVEKGAAKPVSAKIEVK
jgi:beta-glucosidase